MTNRMPRRQWLRHLYTILIQQIDLHWLVTLQK